MVATLFDVPAPRAGEPPAVVLRVVAHPGAGRSAVVGRHGDALKVKVAAPPVDGRANEACAALIAELFGVRPDEVELVSGRTSRAKRFRVQGVDAARATRALDQALAAVSTRGRPRS